MDDLSQFLDVYLEELDEQLRCIEEEMLRLEQEEASQEGIQRLFRAAHTLKGSSAAMGFSRMNGLTHEMEHVLDRARNGELPVEPGMTELFFRCLDGMKLLQGEIVGQGRERSDMDALIAELRRYAKRSLDPSAEVADPFTAMPADVWDSLRDISEPGTLSAKILVRVAAACEMKAVRAFMVDMQLRECGEVVWSNLENPGAGNEESELFAWLAAVNGTQEELRQRLAAMTEIEEVLVEPLMAETTTPAATEGDDRGEPDESARPGRQTGVQKPDESPGKALDSAEGADTTDLKSASGKLRPQTIRVQVDRLEHLMNLVGELVIDQTRMQQLQRLLRHQMGSGESAEAFSALSDHLTRTIGELQRTVMKVRMLPVEQLFNRFPRMVRDMSKKLEKEVELVIEGKDTELDRTIIDEIGDPLTHLIRNALDHGLERPEERKSAGKPEKGMLRISAVHEDNQVVLTVEDDGRGIRAERIRALAVKKGIVTEEEAAKLTDDESVHLIFRPGFSTADEVSDISGRGVGMDIVRTEIERLSGTIDIVTNPGRGTRFHIRLPLTLAIITGLRVRASGREYILPMNSVAEIVREKAKAVRSMNGKPIVQIREQVFPVVSLAELLGRSSPEMMERRHIPLVLIGRSDKRMALAVDELLGNQEVVIKSLGSFVGQTEGVSGATILGNGKVALILDPADLLRMAGSASF